MELINSKNEAAIPRYASTYAPMSDYFGFITSIGKAIQKDF